MAIKIEESVFDKLAEILKRNNLSEIEYKNGDIKIRLASGQQSETGTRPQEVINVDHKEAHHEEKQKIAWEEHAGAVKAPMVGTCYLAPEPGASNFIAIGDIVQKDQPLLIIEAMKVMNLIKAPHEGKIVHIAVANAEPIEFGQLLVVIE